MTDTERLDLLESRLDPKTQGLTQVHLTIHHDQSGVWIGSQLEYHPTLRDALDARAKRMDEMRRP